MFSMFQSTEIIIFIDDQIISTLASGKLFKLAPRSFWHTFVVLDKFSYFLV